MNEQLRVQKCQPFDDIGCVTPYKWFGESACDDKRRIQKESKTVNALLLTELIQSIFNGSIGGQLEKYSQRTFFELGAQVLYNVRMVESAQDLHLLP